MFAAIGSPIFPTMNEALGPILRDIPSWENFPSSPDPKIQTEITGETLFQPPCFHPIHRPHCLRTSFLSNPIRQCSQAFLRCVCSARPRTLPAPSESQWLIMLSTL